MKIEDRCTLEDLQRGGFKYYQLKDGFRFGTDTALLAWFTASFIRRGKSSDTPKLLELGSGCGACSILTYARNGNVSIDACELMEDSFKVLCRNIELNNLQGKINPFNCDIRMLPSEIKNTSYDVVFMNPPFFSSSKGPKTSSSKSDVVLNARFEENGSIDDFIRVASSRVVTTKGFVTMIMKGNRFNDVYASFQRNGLTMTHLLSVHSFNDRNACMFLAAGKKGAGTSELKILPPLILNTKDDLSGDIITDGRVLKIYEEEHTDCFI